MGGLIWHSPMSFTNEMDVLAEECFMAEDSDTWYPDYASCASCQGYIFAPVAAGNPVALELGMCPCAALAGDFLEDEEDEPPVHQVALTLSAALGIETGSKCKAYGADVRSKRLQQIPSKHFGRGNTQRNQRKHRNIMQPRPGF